MTNRLRLAQKVKQARIEAGLSQEDLGKLLHYSGGNISRVENGQGGIDVSDLPKWANALGKPVEWFLSDSKDQPVGPRPMEVILKEAERRMEMLNVVEVPIMGRAPAGTPDLREQVIEGYEAIPRAWLTNAGKNVFAVYVNGESLAGDDLHDGDLVLVDPDAPFADKKIYLVSYRGEIVLRHVIRRNDHVELYSSNGDYKDIKAEEITIQGRVFKRIRSDDY